MYTCKSLARGHYVIQMAVKVLVLKMYYECIGETNQQTNPRSARDAEGAALRTLVVILKAVS